MSITITIQADDAASARREMQALLGESKVVYGGADEALAVINADRGQTFSSETDEPVKDFAEHEKAPEPARRRGRPKKETAAWRSVVEVMAEDPSPDEPEGQIDLEEVIAATNGDVQENEPETVDEPEVQDSAPQPQDPAAGWTEHDARNAGRALLARAPSPEAGHKKLAALLAPFGVQQVKALKTEQILPFVLAANGETF